MRRIVWLTPSVAPGDAEFAIPATFASDKLFDLGVVVRAERVEVRKSVRRRDCRRDRTTLDLIRGPIRHGVEFSNFAILMKRTGFSRPT
jgi:hypothetical protein